MKHGKEYFIRVVNRALDLLEQFHDQTDELDIPHICDRLDISSDKVVRLLATLESAHYIERNINTGNYRLGLKNFSLGQAYIRKMDLQDQARPFLETIVNKCNENANVAIIKESHVIYLDTVAAKQALRVTPRVGLRLPTYCTASGKIQLAYMNDEELDHHISTLELKRYTPATITNREMLRNNLSKAAFLGYAVDNEELDSGVRCVAAPIRNYTNRIIGAVSISGPATRFSDKHLEMELIPLVRQAAEKLSAKLGFYVIPVANPKKHLLQKRLIFSADSVTASSELCFATL